MKKNILVLILVLSALSLTAFADEVNEADFEFGRGRGSIGNEDSEFNRMIFVDNPQFAGNGCDHNTASVSLSPDKKTMSVLLDDFIVEAGRSIGLNRSRKTCNIKLSVKVPSGMRMAVVKLDYRGFNSLVSNSFSHFSSQHYFSESGRNPRGRSIVKRRVRFAGPLEDDFFVTSKVKRRIPWSQCGEDFDLNIEIFLSARTNQQQEDIFSSVDSVDGATLASQYHLLWKSCNPNRRPPHRVNERPNRRPPRPVRDNPGRPGVGGGGNPGLPRNPRPNRR